MTDVPRGYTEFVARQAWGAVPLFPKDIPPLKIPVGNVVATWTDTEPCTTYEQCRAAVRDIQRRHIDQGLPDIKYNFLVGGDGRVYEGRAWRYQAHFFPPSVEDYEILNDNCIEVAFIDKACDWPSDKQFQNFSSVITDGQNTNGLGGIFTFYIEKKGKITLFRTYDPVKDFEDIVPQEVKDQWTRKKLES